MTEELEVIVEEAQALPAVRAHDAMVARAEVSVDDVVAQKDKILAVQKAVMRDGVHYGKIPGISKPSLFKPGAEVLCTTFRFAPAYARNIEWLERADGQRHLLVTVDCTLTHAPSGVVLGSAGGMATTMESKYAYRKAGKTCLTCGKELRRSKQRGDRPPEWYCWAKQGGCGETFAIDNPSIEAQVEGRIDNPDLADTFNTVLKMGDKRALVAAILVCTAASEIFTQDVEDNAQTAVSESESSRGDTAAGDPLHKMRLDIQDLLKQIDRKRKVEGGTTFAEMEVQVRQWWPEDAELQRWDEFGAEHTMHIGQSLGNYFAYVLQAQREKLEPTTFPAWVTQDEVPF